MENLQNSTNSYIDAHCHLAASEFTDDLDTVLERSQNVGVRGCVVVSEFVSEFARVLEICRSHSDLLFPCLGLHPIQTGMTSVTLTDLEAALPLLHEYSADLVGIGEIGLDFTPHLCRSAEERDVQKEVFRRQIQVALQYDLPVNVHSRSAAQEAVGVLKECGARKVLLHNFAGRPSVAMEAVFLGYHLSFPPRVSERSERNKVLKRIPLENLCLETDSPALGVSLMKRNEPCEVAVVCDHIAQLRRLDRCVVASAACHNTLAVFSKIPL